MRNRFVVLALAVIMLGLPGRSPAVIVGTTFNFSGTCTDCSGTGTATLVLSNYTLGTPITTSNFLSLTYNGTNRQAAFTIPAGAPNLTVSGSITNLPGQNTVNIQSSLFSSVNFSSSTNGQWFVGLSDFGSTSVWTSGALPPAPTPVPSTVVLLITGLRP